VRNGYDNAIFWLSLRALSHSPSSMQTTWTLARTV
jgi:hypothetical protein